MAAHAAAARFPAALVALCLAACAHPSPPGNVGQPLPAEVPLPGYQTGMLPTWLDGASPALSTRGLVVLGACVNAIGRVTALEVFHAEPPALAAPVTDAVRGWRFEEGHPPTCGVVRIVNGPPAMPVVLAAAYRLPPHPSPASSRLAAALHDAATSLPVCQDAFGSLVPRVVLARVGNRGRVIDVEGIDRPLAAPVRGCILNALVPVRLSRDDDGPPAAVRLPLDAR